MMHDDTLDDYIPVDIRQIKGRLFVRWIYQGEHPFIEPSFARTVRHLSHEHPRDQRLTDIDALAHVPSRLAPAGFIFHMSRCGSTLVSQMLAAVNRYVVVAEANPINRTLGPDIPDGERNRLLPWAIKALGRRPRGIETHYFIKFSSWNVFYLPLIRTLFPDTPWIFIYRDPVEVLGSLIEKPPGWIRNKATRCRLSGFIDNPSDMTQSAFETWGASLLEAYCRTALASVDDNGLLLNYSELPEGFARVMDFFQVETSEAEQICMRKRATFYSKAPAGQQVFMADVNRKQREATPAILEADRQHTREVYEALESCRKNQISRAGLDLDIPG